MTTIQTPDAVLTVSFSPDLEDGNTRTFTLTTDQGETWYHGPFLNENDVLSGLGEALAQGHAFMVSDKGVFATHGQSEVHVFCGPHATTLSGCASEWWELLAETPERINALYNAVLHSGMIPSTASPGVVYLADPEEGGWLRELDLDYLPASPEELSLAFDDYSGRCLVCPDDHALRIVELCAEPGSYYGPYRVMSAHHHGRYHPVYEAESMDRAKAVTLEMAKYGAPEPLPAWREDCMKVVRMPHGLTAVMYPHFTSGMDIWIEEYFADILDHKGCFLTTLSLDENMGELITYRDNPAKFLDTVAQKCPEADLKDLKDRTDQWSELPVQPEFADKYADVPIEPFREVRIGTGQKLVIHAPVEADMATTWEAELYLTDNITLKIKKFNSYCGAFKGLDVVAEVRSVDGEIDNVPIPSYAQHLGPLVQQVLSGKISEQSVLAGLARQKAYWEEDAKSKASLAF